MLLVAIRGGVMFEAGLPGRDIIYLSGEDILLVLQVLVCFFILRLLILSYHNVWVPELHSVVATNIRGPESLAQGPRSLASQRA